MSRIGCGTSGSIRLALNRLGRRDRTALVRADRRRQGIARRSEPAARLTTLIVLPNVHSGQWLLHAPRGLVAGACGKRRQRSADASTVRISWARSLVPESSREDLL